MSGYWPLVLGALAIFAAGTSFGHWLRGHTETRRTDEDAAKARWQRKQEQAEPTETERALRMPIQHRKGW